jgi:hypothetical protein
MGPVSAGSIWIPDHCLRTGITCGSMEKMGEKAKKRSSINGKTIWKNGVSQGKQLTS